MRIRRFIAAVMAICMVTGAVGYDSPAFSEYAATADAAEALCCDFDMESGELTLKGNVVASQITEFLHKDSVKYIIASAGTILPEDCSDLFAHYNNCTFIDLAGASKSKVTNMKDMFLGCESLSSIDFGTLDTSTVTDMSGMFAYCKGLLQLNISYLNTKSVTRMSSMFEECDNLVKLDIGGLDTRNVTDMSYMFSGCSSLTELDMTGIDTSKVENMYAMFDFCRKLRSLDLSSFDMSNVSNTQHMLSYCSELKQLHLGEKFGNITEDFELPNEWGWVNSNADEKVISGSGKYVVIENSGDNTYLANASEDACYTYDSNTGEMTLHGNIVSSEIRSFEHKADVGIIYAEAGTVFPENSKALFAGYGCVYASLENADMSHVKDMNIMFSSCPNLNAVFMDFADTRNVTDMGGMFLNCHSLKTVSMAGVDTSQVTDMGEMFHGCTSLEELDISSFNAGNANKDYMFWNCMSLNKLTIGDNFGDIDETYRLPNNYAWVNEKDTSTPVSGSGTYAVISNTGKNTYLKSNSIPDDVCYTFDSNSSILTLHGNVSLEQLQEFSYKKFVKVVIARPGTVLPESCKAMFAEYSDCRYFDLASADTSHVTDMSAMFASCSSMTIADLSGFDTSNVSDMTNMFYNCTSIRRLDLSSFDTRDMEDTSMSDMFKNCNKLSLITLGENYGNISSYQALTTGSGWVNVKKDTALVSRSDGSIKNTGRNTYFRLGSETAGDINFDSYITVSDLVALQRWLMAAPNADVPYWKAADTDGDGKLNAFDACELRDMLSNLK